jgi:hypothetical protein
MKGGAGATGFLAKNTNTHEKCVLKYSYVDPKDKERFEEQMNLNTKSEHIVLLKEYYFFTETNSCLVSCLIIHVFICNVYLCQAS